MSYCGFSLKQSVGPLAVFSLNCSSDTDYSYSAPYNYVFELHGIWGIKRDRITKRTVKYLGNSQRDILRDKNEEPYLEDRCIGRDWNQIE